ncbi:thiamine pyrophosphate-binding protein, partial [Salmonella enterica subsp. enterica serovar Anatum]|nr:thiamine pyrophosphate-binding protein [Salmonella enterica subsp. enterica serovar Anatum]
ALYSASADSIPILCITGQAPRARLHKEDFQAVDIEAIAKPVSRALLSDVNKASCKTSNGDALLMTPSSGSGDSALIKRASASSSA